VSKGERKNIAINREALREWINLWEKKRKRNQSIRELRDRSLVGKGDKETYASRGGHLRNSYIKENEGR